jgi:energy-converting hydrogenase A subunit M
MRKSKQTTALALVGAIALASGAYALGSQAGDGSAEAAKNGAQNAAPYGAPGPGHRFGGPGRGFGGDRPGLDRLASKLDVSEATLEKALEDLRADRPDPKDRRADLAQELADALNIDVAKVNQAFDKLKVARDDHKDDFAAALAKQLGVSTAKVQSALSAQRDHRGDPAALAKALDVSEQKLRQAFESLRRDHGPRDGHRGPNGAALAKALGVTQAHLNAAFDKLRQAKEAEFAKLRDQFAQKLADKLNLDVAKVKDALDDFAPPFGRHHP